MTIKINDATPNRPEGHRLIQAHTVQVNFSEYIQQLKQEKAWQTSDRNAITVFKAQGITVVITALHEYAEINDLQVEGVVILQVMEGSVMVLHEGAMGHLSDRQMLILYEAPASSIKAMEDCVLQLTYVKNISAAEGVL